MSEIQSLDDTDEQAFPPPVAWNDKPAIKQITVRATFVGLIIGSLVLISNFQFGLQTGWVSMMSMPSALLACAFFKKIWPAIRPNDGPFTDVETVYVQSMAVAVGTGPLAYGFVGVIPAIEKFLTKEESGFTREQGQLFSFNQLLAWSCALAFFGVFFAVPLRKQVVVREKLPFPSGSATAVLIAVLNDSEILQEVSRREILEMRTRRLDECSEVLMPDSVPSSEGYSSFDPEHTLPESNTYNENINVLSLTFLPRQSIPSVAIFYLYLGRFHFLEHTFRKLTYGIFNLPQRTLVRVL